MTHVTHSGSSLAAASAVEDALRRLLRRCFPHVRARADDGVPGAERLAGQLDLALRAIGPGDDDMAVQLLGSGTHDDSFTVPRADASVDAGRPDTTETDELRARLQAAQAELEALAATLQQVDRERKTERAMAAELARAVQRMWQDQLRMHEELLSADAGHHELAGWLRSLGLAVADPPSRPALQQPQVVEDAARIAGSLDAFEAAAAL